MKVHNDDKFKYIQIYFLLLAKVQGKQQNN